MVRVLLITLLAMAPLDLLVSKRLTQNSFLKDIKAAVLVSTKRQEVKCGEVRPHVQDVKVEPEVDGASFAQLGDGKENVTDNYPRGHDGRDHRDGGRGYRPNRGSSRSGGSRSSSHNRSGDGRRRRWLEHRRGGGNEHHDRGIEHHDHDQWESLIGELLSDVFAALGPGAGVFEFEPNGEQEQRPPATAEAFLQDMPVVNVTENDVEAENDECSICYDKLLVGDPALRIPCGHLFHEGCVRKWLESSNKCPVCRYELPTDDADFENGRLERMKHRRPRLRAKDLAMRSVRELHLLADLLGVSTEGCLEKQDLADALVHSGQVDIIPAVPKTLKHDSTSVPEAADEEKTAAEEKAVDEESAADKKNDADEQNAADEDNVAGGDEGANKEEAAEEREAAEKEKTAKDDKAADEAEGRPSWTDAFEQSLMDQMSRIMQQALLPDG